jgi:hypothetical protein
VEAKGWLAMISRLSNDQIKVGLAETDKRITRRVHEGNEKDNWPPTAVEFDALAKPQFVRGHKPFNHSKAIESDEHKSKRKKAGAKHIDQLKDLFK